jgi:hypothetical protein
MVRKLSLIAALLIVSACAPTVPPVVPTGTPMIMLTVAPRGEAPTPLPNETPPPTASSNSSSSLPAASLAASPTSGPLKATPSPAVPKPGEGKTYVNSQWQVAVDYPPEWSVRDQVAGVVFTSPQGAQILLAAVDTGGLTPQDYLDETLLPNTRCTSGTNAHGVAVRACFDTISFSYTTFLILKPSGAGRLLSLSTGARASLEVFNTMTASARPAP